MRLEGLASLPRPASDVAAASRALEDPVDEDRAALGGQKRRAPDDERFEGGATEDVGRDEVAAGSEGCGLKRTEAVMAQVFE